jgi:MFS family permease
MPVLSKVLVAALGTGLALALVAWGGSYFRRGLKTQTQVLNGVIFLGLGAAFLMMLSAAWITLLLPKSPAMESTAEGLYGVGLVGMVLAAPVARYAEEQWARKQPSRLRDFVEDPWENSVATHPDREYPRPPTSGAV